MTRYIRCATLVAILFSFAFAPSAAMAQATTNVVVLDVSQIFKNHNKFKQSMEAMKAEVQAFEGELRGRAKQIEGLREKMRGYKAGTAEYNSLEEQVAKASADGQAKTQQKRREFLTREARIYYNTYQQIQQEVEKFAQQYKVDLVVRFNSAPIDPDDRHSVLEGVNRAVVYQNRKNVTKYVLDAVNRGTTPAAAGPGVATQPRGTTTK